MTVFEKARELGVMLSETTQGKRLADAKYIFDGNEEAQKLFFDYQQERDLYRTKLSKGEVTESEKEKFVERTREIQNNPIIVELLLAENEFADFTQMVFDIAKATAEGEMPIKTTGGCTGKCSTCGGCY